MLLHFLWVYRILLLRYVCIFFTHLHKCKPVNSCILTTVYKMVVWVTANIPFCCAFRIHERLLFHIDKNTIITREKSGFAPKIWLQFISNFVLYCLQNGSFHSQEKVSNLFQKWQQKSLQ